MGFFAAGFARGVIDVVILVLGALAGAAIVLGFLDLFNMDIGFMRWVLAVIGGVIGLMLIRRGRRATKDWGLIILAGLVGALLVTSGLNLLIPSLSGAIGALIAVVLAAGDIVYQGGLFSDDNSAESTE